MWFPRKNGSHHMIQYAFGDIYIKGQIVIQLHPFAKTWHQIPYRNYCWGGWCEAQDHVNVNIQYIQFNGSLHETPDLCGDNTTIGQKHILLDKFYDSLKWPWDTTTTVNRIDLSVWHEIVKAFTQNRNQKRMSNQCCTTTKTTKMRPYPPT